MTITSLPHKSKLSLKYTPIQCGVAAWTRVDTFQPSTLLYYPAPQFLHTYCKFISCTNERFKHLILTVTTQQHRAISSSLLVPYRTCPSQNPTLIVSKPTNPHRHRNLDRISEGDPPFLLVSSPYYVHFDVFHHTKRITGTKHSKHLYTHEPWKLKDLQGRSNWNKQVTNQKSLAQHEISFLVKDAVQMSMRMLTRTNSLQSAFEKSS